MDEKITSINDQGEFDPYILSLTDEDGKEYNFEVLDDIDYNDGRYMAMQPVFDDGSEMLADSGDLVILKVVDDGNGEEALVEIEDDNEYEEVVALFADRLQDFFEIDEE